MDPSPSPTPSPDACESIALALERFADGGASPSAERRAHARACASCGARYRSGVLASARSARRALRERPEPDCPTPRARLPLVPFGAASLGFFAAPGARSGRGAALRLILGPALLLFLLTRFSGSLAGRALPTVELRGGEVSLNATPLALEHPLRLGRGATLVTGDASAAVLRDGESEVSIGARTVLLVERVGPPRVRLEQGTVALTGPVVLTTAEGVLALESGSAEVALEAGGLEIECAEGAAEWVDARGSRRLGPGGRHALGRSGAASSR